uniref:Uncharacterized protein n=1 Tax=Eptatretus burgeri TaxID=7764 RepID=A0A8C4N065_EPTBU
MYNYYLKTPFCGAISSNGAGPVTLATEITAMERRPPRGDETAGFLRMAEEVREAGEGIYRSRDPIRHFKVRFVSRTSALVWCLLADAFIVADEHVRCTPVPRSVRLTKASSAGALSRRVQAEAAHLTSSDTELATFRPSAAGEDEEGEEVLISWQQKLFSKRESELYRDPTFCLSPLERQYHEDLVKMDSDGGLTTRRIFTYTENDPYTRSHEVC